MINFLQFISIFTFFTASLLGNVEPYLKKIQDKTDNHRIRNIDFIYMINLDQRPEKWKKSLDQLAPYGIYPYRFSAVNGWELTLEDINKIGMQFQSGMRNGIMATWYPFDGNFQPSHEMISCYGRSYFCHCFARGTMGIILSHLSVLQDAYDSGYKTVWVMEDDIEVFQNPMIISDLIEELDCVVGQENWDVLFTDQDIRGSDGKYVPCFGAAVRPNFNPPVPNDYAEKLRINDHFRKIGARYGAHSMIIRRSGVKKILEFIKTHGIFLPYDMDNYLPLGIQLYTVLDDVVSNLSKALSDNGKPNYAK